MRAMALRRSSNAVVAEKEMTTLHVRSVIHIVEHLLVKGCLTSSLARS